MTDGLTPDGYATYGVTVDLVILTIRADELCVLVVRRGLEPFAGAWALPGGFVRPGETLEAAARRELAEETGLGFDPPSPSVDRVGRVDRVDRVDRVGRVGRPGAAGGGPPARAGRGDGPAGHAGRHGGHLEQLAAYGAIDRDPRARVITVAFLALAPDLPSPLPGTDAAAADWMPVTNLAADRPALAFDHALILADGLERARSKLEYTSLAAAFCPAEFTVAELRRVYEIVWGAPLDPRNFHRKVTGTPGFLAPVGRSTTRDGGRPAALYRRGAADILHPAMRRRPTASS